MYFLVSNRISTAWEEASSEFCSSSRKTRAGVRPVCSNGDCVRQTCEFPRIPGQDLVDECPLVHFNRFIAPGAPLHVDSSEEGIWEDGLHVPMQPSLL